ncbi:MULTISPECIES: hypothetical protein [Hyphomicrobiales]|uniref:hypothetical protein n=1 Tax=Hyphomicrobiales TaxID=356 RepID=UPI00058F7437|nr:hypothetical protein [Hoeflea sp. 108]
MKAPTRYVESRARRSPPAIYAIGFALRLLAAGVGVAHGLPETLTGKVQIYDGVTFDLIQDGGRYRMATRIRLEAVDSCELRQKARLGNVDWPCGAVGTAWLASRTLAKDVECRPTRVIRGGGYHAQCYVNGLDIAALGLEEGMYVVAVPQGEQPPAGYPELEARAKAAGVGIWSSEFMKPADWRRAYGTYNPLAPQR